MKSFAAGGRRTCKLPQPYFCWHVFINVLESYFLEIFVTIACPTLKFQESTYKEDIFLWKYNFLVLL